MGFIFWFLLTFLLGYLAWRAIRGGFERPQSENLNAYGILTCVLAFVVVVSWLAHVFG